MDQISLSLESGYIYGFIGRNGCGKTTLFRALCGLMHVDNGDIMLDDKILHRDIREICVTSTGGELPDVFKR